MTQHQDQHLLATFKQALTQVADLSGLELLEKDYVGKNSALRNQLKNLKDIPPESRAQVAQGIHATVAVMTDEINAAREKLMAQHIQAQLAKEWVDISLPGTVADMGALHPVTQMADKIIALLKQIGFSLQDGPEVETPFYNFDALNIPKHHPARDMQDTFWLDNELLLRSHTTPIQARVLESRPALPIKIAACGRVYRNEAIDATHLAMFHQLEGFWVEKDINFAHLKGILTFILQKLYGEKVAVRFKPKYYPYTEPSIGVDISCTNCYGSGCIACHHAGWVTLMGAGMIHRSILELFGIDDPQVRGFAFGFGLTRMVSQYLGISRIRSLYENDQRLFAALKRTGL